MFGFTISLFLATVVLLGTNANLQKLIFRSSAKEISKAIINSEKAPASNSHYSDIGAYEQNPRLSLQEKRCLENPYLKMCFDNQFGGAVSAIYNKREANPVNLELPSVGAAFQIAFRSLDPITPCPHQSALPPWVLTWNPTQAGCENCIADGDTIYHVGSPVYNERFSSGVYQIDFRPLNYIHDNHNDCRVNMPFTTTGPATEDMYVKQKVENMTDYMKITWDITHQGNDSHLTYIKKGYEHEMPTFYMKDNGDCLSYIYKDKNGTIKDQVFPCYSGKVHYEDGLLLYANLENSWYSVYNPKRPNQVLTIIGNYSKVDNSLVKSGMRNYWSDNGMQVSMGQPLSFSPKMQVTETVYVLPYKYGETMKDGTSVADFIAKKQEAKVTGSAQLTTDCKTINGTANYTSSGGNQPAKSVELMVNNMIVGEVAAGADNQFHFDYQINGVGASVVVLARDEVSRNYKTIFSTVSSCPAQAAEKSCPIYAFPRRLGNANCDTLVNVLDFGYWYKSYVNKQPIIGDFNGDGKVDIDDYFNILLANWRG